MTTLWDTTGSAVVKALSAERRAAGALAFGLALTLVVVVDEKNVAAAESAATAAAAAHPCRLLIVVRRQIDAPHPRLDAEVSIGGRLGPGEAIVMRMYGRLALHAESVVLPLLASDAPVVTWWQDEPPTRIAFDPLGVFADRRVTDCDRAPDPLAALQLRAADFEPGDTDLAWTRISGWRTLLAAAFDGRADRPRSAHIDADPSDPSAHLFAGWLRAKLGVPVDVVGTGKRGIQAVRVAVDDGEVAVSRADARSGNITRPGVPPRRLPLRQLDVGDLLAEELRRLDHDVIYAEALSAWSGIPDLAGRSGHREHIWQDPMEQPPATPATASATAKSGPVAEGGS
ncbi:MULTISPECIES: glucose-6-phosphate dehydrogenase assembly protein OpcA [unclassified Pseudofrankia]|uniref:glucose-6-phosphate dehydrogenase assembly protein OpcA n=1 Tax=unclassified Pseudofrankia TaxID=2994372 RepID=UPI0008D9E9E2|nr:MULTISPECIES: glucose-6-phosphate dehydrogenase assembly protein OpcA [unclassified Pseudofrankia]MDT3438390.1 glucose-6-phosphate dehydrogenase assembly protein OpcA [Pseudofrankia sp. BMG5.37]OHV67835.1 glucose-6-phosphate dehydrogenase [Pseudofrankia sp. BMG5.36]